MVSIATQQPVVLSADDDENAHLLLESAFAKAGVGAILKQADDGSEAIRYLSGEGPYADRTKYPLPDLLLLDLKMPRVSGFGVLEYLKKHPQLRKFPVIVFSSSSNDEDVKRAHALGCDSYVVKPTSFDKLIQLVEAIGAEFLGTSRKQETDKPSAAAIFSDFKSLVPSPKIRDKGGLRIGASSPNPVESPDIFRLLVEQVKDYAIFMLDRDGYVRSWNEGARRIKGYESHEVIGKHFSIFYPRQDVESEKPQFELRIALEIGRYEEEGWRVRKDGSRFWANVIITQLRDAEGNLTGFAKVTRDLTQRKLQEENFQRLLDSEERFRQLVEQVKDYAIFMLDAKGNVISWNQGARRVNGYTADEIIGRHFSTFYPPEDIKAGKPARELHIAVQEGRYEEEDWRIRKDGTYFWASVVITALWDKRGNLTGFAKVTRDLTHRKKEEEALRHKTEELEAFAHTLSHDLRSPLRSIYSFAQLLKIDTSDPAQQESYLNKIIKAAQSMESLIDGILKLSQLSLAPAPEQIIALDDVIDETVELLESEIEKTKAEISIKKPLPLVRANRTLLIQIFSNLIANGLKFAGSGQTPIVEVYSIVRGTKCEIHVKDHGIGIPPQFYQTIFKVFERGTTDTDVSGTGVGLAIVKRAVERAGGSVSVQSKEGEGSDFTVVLPCEVPLLSPESAPLILP